MTYCSPPLNGAYYSWQMGGGSLRRPGVQMARGNLRTPYKVWEVGLYKSTGVRREASVGDINGDGKMEIVIHSFFDDPPNPFHRVYALDPNTGDSVWVFYKPTDISTDYFEGSIVIADVDGDGTMEILVGSVDKKLFILNGEDGSLQDTLRFPNRVAFTGAVADIDGDGRAEIVVGPYQYDTLYAFNGEDLSVLWKTYAPTIYRYPVLGDVDGDRDMDVVIGLQDRVAAFDGASGNLLWETPTPYGESPQAMAVADVNDDGTHDAIYATAHFVVVLNGADGSTLWRSDYLPWPLIALAVHDVDTDGVPEIIVKGNYYYGVDTIYAFGGNDGSLEWKQTYAFNGNGYFPTVADIHPSSGYEFITLSGYYILVLSSTGDSLYDLYIPWAPKEVTVADVDGDGCVEMVVVGGSFSTSVHVALIDDSTASACPLGGNGDLSTRERVERTPSEGVAIFTVDGRLIHRGGRVPTHLPKGVYFVREGRRIHKMVVR